MSDQDEYMQNLKEDAKREAENRSAYERERILSYDKLRYTFSPWTVDAYYNDLLSRSSVTYHPQKSPSKTMARKDAQIGVVQWIKSRFNPDKKKEVDKVIQKSQERLQQETDEFNKREYERCQRANKRVQNEIDEKLRLFLNGDSDEVSRYFTFVVDSDDYSLDNQQRYEFSFCLEYDYQSKRILIDYRMPRSYDISDIKGWRLTKDYDVEPKRMSKKDFLQQYEKILFDLVVRTVSLIFESDDRDVVSEVLFNASTVYDEAPDRIIFFISAIIPKKNYIRQDIRNYGFVSKRFISQMKQARYLGDLHNDDPPSILADRPPMKLVIPIRTMLQG